MKTAGEARQEFKDTTAHLLRLFDAKSSGFVPSPADVELVRDTANHEMWGNEDIAPRLRALATRMEQYLPKEGEK